MPSGHVAVTKGGTGLRTVESYDPQTGAWQSQLTWPSVVTSARWSLLMRDAG
jgi:hypothetical protein